MTISRNNPLAMYLQIANKLKQEIFSKKYKPGEKIGTQRELEERFNVSKITVRKAIEVLQNEGLVMTSHGRGTFVKPEKVEQSLDQLHSLSEIIQHSGYSPHVQIYKIATLTKDECFIPEDTDSEEFLYIERLHTVNDKPIAFAQAYIPYALSVNWTKEDLEQTAIYDLLEQQGIQIGHASQLIEACPATDKLAQRLAVKEDSPLLKAERTTFCVNNKLIEKIIFYYRYEEYSFKINLNRADQSPMWPPILK